jgi:hypothetical protein
LKESQQTDQKRSRELERELQRKDFVRGYNREHRHSAIRYVTPAQRHVGDDRTILAARKRVYQAAEARHPERWTGSTRIWAPIGEVWLNPVKQPPTAGDPLLEAA